MTRGLVPWRFLVSAAHAELDVRAIQLTLPTDLASPHIAPHRPTSLHIAPHLRTPPHISPHRPYTCHQVRAIQLTLPTDLGGIEEVEKGARLANEVRVVGVRSASYPPYISPYLPHQVRVVEVRSGGTQLGVEVDERNVVVRIRPGSVAERKLRLGDEILALDETELAGKWLGDVIANRPPREVR